MAVEWHPHARCCWCAGKFWRSGTVWVCATPACAARQQAWSVKIGDTYVFVPTPRAVEFFEAAHKTRRTLYGGAAGGAKSHTLRWGAYRLCLTVPNASVLILRKTYKELERTHFKAFAKDAQAFGAKWVPSANKMVFANGSQIEAGHCENAQAFETYLSTEYDRIIVDELVTLDEEPMIELMTRARSSKPEIAKMGGATFWAGTNPGGRGALWVRDFFITRGPDPDKYPGYEPSWYAFIPAKVDDNPYVDVDYRQNLAQLPEMRRRQLLDGDWTAYEGRFFGEFRPTKDGQPWHVADVRVPEGVEWVGSMDWGYNSPGVYAFWACLHDGHYHRVYERKFQGADAETVAAWMLEDRKRIVTDRGGRLRYVAADPSMWNHTGAGRGESIAESFTRRGLPLRKADNERGANGWQPCHELLRMAPDGRPWLSISPTCTYFLRTIPVIGQDPQDPDDVDTKADDHAADDYRYFARSRPSPTRHKEPTLPKGALGHDLRAARTEAHYAHA
jgi:phage terminase large subunit